MRTRYNSAYNTTPAAGHGNGGGNDSATTGRRPGWEFRVLGWLTRHPLIALTPAVLVLGVARLGPIPTGVTVAALGLSVVVWWRAHPHSFDRYAAPRLRTLRRRWTTYRGGRWAWVLESCDLVRTHPRTGHLLVPRVGRVRAVTPSIDTLRVRMAPGQDLRAWTDQLPALADTLGAHRVAVTRRRPGELAVVVERTMPFTFVVEPTPIPELCSQVDLSRVRLGEDEYGRPFTIAIRGRHFLGVGATGSGKSGLLWNLLRGITPLVRDGLARVWVIDLKGGTETQAAASVFHRWATDGEQAVALLTEYRDAMLARQAAMREQRVRTNTITTETPFELLVIDELAMLTAYGDRQLVRDALRLLAEIMTQGRAADYAVAAYVQEPSKDVVDVRDLFTTRACLGVTAAVHVDMALGDGARDRGALADEIPGDGAHAGIGFAIAPGSRLPVRLRAGLVTDADITEFVTRATPDPTATEGGDVVPLRKPTTDPTGTEEAS
jgi:DNA segregation ATPase FtsK/SpoIIIE, S-DNA-T family